MRAIDFTRHDCKVGNRRITYATLTREWQCDQCGGRLVEKWNEGWRVECGRCGSKCFVHDNQAKRDRHRVLEVLDGLPQELVEQLK